MLIFVISNIWSQIVSVQRVLFFFPCYTPGSCIGSMARNANWPLAVEILRLMPKCPDERQDCYGCCNRSDENNNCGIRVLNLRNPFTWKCPCVSMCLFRGICGSSSQSIQFTYHLIYPVTQSHTNLGSVASKSTWSPTYGHQLRSRISPELVRYNLTFAACHRSGQWRYPLALAAQKLGSGEFLPRSQRDIRWYSH